MKSKVFAPDNSFMDIFAKAVDCIILSVVWLVCSIPVFTVGASSCGLYYAYQKAIRQNRSYACREFFAAFKSNFKQATGSWLMLLMFLLLSVFTCYMLFVLQKSVPMAGVLLMLGMVIVGFTVVWCIYLFPYQARFENTMLTAMKNSALLAVANMPWSLLLLVIFGAAVAIAVSKPVLAVPVVAVYIWLTNKILERIFRKLMTREELIMEMELDKG